VLFKEDTIYERSDLVAIIMKETQIKCKTPGGEACALTFKMTNPVNNTYFYMIDHSMIHASRVFIESPQTRLTIDATSEIETNGRSTNTKGTVSGVQGASFLGRGGYCGSEPYQDRFYGQFFMEPYPENIYDMQYDNMLGSMGTIGDLATGGGGHIHINVDSLNLTGTGF